MQSHVPVDLSELDRQLALRSWTKQKLADAMRVSRVTVWKIYRDRAAAPGLFAKLTVALEANPPGEMSARLMGEPIEGAA